MKCDLCGKKVNVHEVVQESKLCRSCFSMVNEELSLCDLCGIEINIDQFAEETKLCRSCFSMLKDEQSGDELKLPEKPILTCSVCQKQVYVYYNIDNDIICGRCFGGEDTANTDEVLKQTNPYSVKPFGFKRLSFFALIAICSIGGLYLLSPFIFWGLIFLAMGPPLGSGLTFRYSMLIYHHGS